ncbi:expressed unknown protein [Seminavis robusta]|uniref:DUF4400 domain-containing protein n=1 Tax=Seminavis robusta TaxID=568900 RepID=A0A9N8E4C0_9STRA|nr:expressed unknown protein [Seminavis robusta]|eukprot:Sro651_g181570.1 n/a (215) ;mRNA; r:29919-31040
MTPKTFLFLVLCALLSVCASAAAAPVIPAEPSGAKAGAASLRGSLTEWEKVKRRLVCTDPGCETDAGVAPTPGPASNYATPTGPDEEGYDPQFVEFQGSISSGISQQSMTHYLLAPLRLLCLGIAPQLCQNEVLLDQQGSPHYIQFMLDLANHARVHFSATAQAFMMMIFVIGLAPFALTEAMVGPALAPWLLALMGFAIFYKHKQNQAKAKTA